MLTWFYSIYPSGKLPFGKCQRSNRWRCRKAKLSAGEYLCRHCISLALDFSPNTHGQFCNAVTKMQLFIRLRYPCLLSWIYRYNISLELRAHCCTSLVVTATSRFKGRDDTAEQLTLVSTTHPYESSWINL